MTYDNRGGRKALYLGDKKTVKRYIGDKLAWEEFKKKTVEVDAFVEGYKQFITAYWYGVERVGIKKVVKIEIKGQTIRIVKYSIGWRGNTITVELPLSISDFGISYINKFDLITIYYT